VFKKELFVLASLISLTCISSQGHATINVTVPDLKPGFEVSGGVLYLQPSARNLNYTIYNQELPAQSPLWTEKEINSSYGAAFELGVRYTFCKQGGNDINLNWVHLNTTSSASVRAPNANFFLGPDFEIGPTGLITREASGSANFKYDVVNLDVGQHISFGNHVSMRFFGGISGGFLRETVSTNYTGSLAVAPGGNFYMQPTNYSNFSGAGPRVGLDLAYQMNSGFGFMGEAAGSALIGMLHSRFNIDSFSPALTAIFGQTTNNFQSIIDENNTQVVPGVDARLGLTYKYTFNNNMILNAQLGYTAAVYVNAINQVP